MNDFADWRFPVHPFLSGRDPVEPREIGWSGWQLKVAFPGWATGRPTALAPAAGCYSA